MSHDLWDGYYRTYTASVMDRYVEKARVINADEVCVVGRAGPASFACGHYGAFTDMVSFYIGNQENENADMWAQYIGKAVYHWAVQMFHAYWDDNVEGRWKGLPRYKPPGEYVLGHGGAGAPFHDRDSDIHRHAAGPLGAAFALRVPEIVQHIRDESVVHDAIMLYLYWLAGYGEAGATDDPRGVTWLLNPGQGYGHALQNEQLVGGYWHTGDPILLDLAYEHFRFHFSDAASRNVDDGWWTWDTGRDSLPLGGDLQGLGGKGPQRKKKAPAEADLTMWPWYIGDWMRAMYRLFRAISTAPPPFRGAQDKAENLVDRMKRLGRWCDPTERLNAPTGDLSAPGARDFYMHPVQGFRAEEARDRWLWPDGQWNLAPAGWQAAWDADTPYWTGAILKFIDADGGFKSGFYDDGSTRYHHQWSGNMPPRGPATWGLSGSGSRIGDGAYIHYLAKSTLGTQPGHEERKLGAEMLIHDCLAFAGEDSGAKVVQRSKRWTSVPSIKGNVRSLAWMWPGTIAAENELGPKLEDLAK